LCVALAAASRNSPQGANVSQCPLKVAAPVPRGKSQCVEESLQPILKARQVMLPIEWITEPIQKRFPTQCQPFVTKRQERWTITCFD
jgi:hypothetical protein